MVHMTTTLLIKTDKKLKEAAQGISAEMGLGLTTVINALLRNFVRERRLVLDLEPRVSDVKMNEWRKISEQANRGIGTSGPFSSADDLLKHLKI